MKTVMPSRLKKILSKPKLLIPTIIVAIGVILGVVILAGRSDKPAQAAPRPLDVEVVRIEQKDVPIYSEWIGTTDGMVNADIKAEVTGYLLRQDYKEGSFVKKGQLLFEIDPRPFQAAVDQANGQVAQFQGQLEQATSQVAQAEAQVAQASSQLLQSQAQLAQAQANRRSQSRRRSLSRTWTMLSRVMLLPRPRSKPPGLESKRRARSSARPTLKLEQRKRPLPQQRDKLKTLKPRSGQQNLI